jgi:hypothetical protein
VSRMSLAVILLSPSASVLARTLILLGAVMVLAHEGRRGSQSS